MSRNFPQISMIDRAEITLVILEVETPWREEIKIFPQGYTASKVQQREELRELMGWKHDEKNEESNSNICKLPSL